MADNELENLRAEIDAVDAELLDLLIRRNRVSERVKQAKSDQSMMLRPGREANILRKLIERNAGTYPPQTLLHIWREIFSASLALQGAVSTAVFIPDGSHVLWDMARDHFGSTAAITGHTTPRRVVEAVVFGESSLGVLPIPHRQNPDPWWQYLLVLPNAANEGRAARIIARLPFAQTGEGAAEALVIAMMEPDPSGDDRSFLAFILNADVPADKLSQAMADAGLNGELAARWHDQSAPERWITLAEFDGYVSLDDGRIAAFSDQFDGQVSQIVWLGSYARPLRISNKTDAG